MQTVSALLVVMGAMLLLPLVLRALGFARPRGGRGTLQVVDSCALGAKQRIHVVEIEGERLLVGATEQSVQLLKTLPAAASPAASTDAEPSRPRRPWQRVLARAGFAVLALGLLCVAPAAAAQELALTSPEGGSASLHLDLDDLTSPDRLSSTVQALLILTLFSVAPSLLLMMTSFTRIVIVLALARQAIGIHGLPPNQVIVGLAVFTTLYVMAPVGTRIHEEAYTPYVNQEIDADAAIDLAIAPVRGFLSHHTREKDLNLFVDMAGGEPPASLDDVPFSMLVPAYLISEIRTAFEMGFMIYLPFLVIDIVIASMLISMGMIVLPPVVISLPFKLMLFVLIDGWNLVISTLVTGLR